ncbi:MAG: GIY-YIG nuclease family protein [Candidatus Paceibacterota bacterium]
MYWIYILENIDDESWYIGYTTNLRRHVDEHSSGKGGQTTRRKYGWILIYCEGYKHQDDAKGRERYLKSGSGRKYLEEQLRNYLNK